ncbi:MAG: ISAs1 family transposase, partial [Paracoccus sp. (in: a-proteobacteria)]
HAIVAVRSGFDHPLLATATRGSLMARTCFDTAALTSLAAEHDLLVDPRKARGIRHSFTTTLMIVACATLAGRKSIEAIGEWGQDASQEVLERLNARIDPKTGKRIAPHPATIRRALLAVDADAFDRIVTTWAATQATHHQPPQPSATHDDTGDDGDDDGAGADGDDDGSGDDGDADGSVDDGDDDGSGDDGDADGSVGMRRGVGRDLVGVSVDGKTLRGARRGDGTQTQLLAALRQDFGTVIGQANVDNDKTNEIRAFAPLLTPLDIDGMVITADALHTQTAAATLLASKAAHYLFGVKANQPTLHNTATAILDKIDLDTAAFETTSRGHGRIDRHRIWTADVPDTNTFPHAAR